MSVFRRQSIQDRAVSSAVLSDLGPGMHPRISIRGGQFALVDAAGMRYGAPVLLRNTPQGQQLVMLAIIIGSNPKKSRVFYGSKYDPDNPGPPDCFSDNGVAPSENSSSPQARTCGECEWQRWGSDTSQLTGKKTKACNEKKKIALLVVNDTTGLPYELQIPPATLKNMATYAATLAQGTPPGESRRADVSDMVTAISFVPGQTGILQFAPFAWLTSSYLDENGTLCVAADANLQPLTSPDGGESVGRRIDEIWDSHELDELLGLKDRPWTPPVLASPLPGMTGYMEPQAHGGALQRGTIPAGPSSIHASQLAAQQSASPYAPPNPGMAPAQPQTPFTAPASSQPLSTAPQQAMPQQQISVPATRTPRTRKAPQAAGATAPVTAQHVQASTHSTAPMQDIPDFLRRSQQPPTPPAQAANGPAHGMVEAQRPPADIGNVLDAAFKLNTTRT